MYLEVQRRISRKFRECVHQLFELKIAEPALDTPPNSAMGDLSLAACFELARALRRSPREIAQTIAPHLLPLEGLERVDIAGAGYLNFYLERPAFAAALFGVRHSPVAASSSAQGKILVEHTSINPNKAAHIGHLRNAVLGDTFVRLLRFQGNQVEIQNYIDNTGVQVADVVVGFLHLEKKNCGDVQQLMADPLIRFDYHCWDLYAQVFRFYADNPAALSLRSEALRAIEEGQGEMAAMAEMISTAIVRAHLETMWRLNVRYDLLAQESEILRLDFWRSAFELLKERGAIRFASEGKNQGCWVMSLAAAGPDEGDAEAGEEDVKIIVRSNGTVTYVGKDIAYHLWKFGLLGKDFGYSLFWRYPDQHPVWRTTVEGQPDAPPFGHATLAYSVIDQRQSYLQNIVAAAFRALGYQTQADNLRHFAYEVVGLSPRCAEELGLELNEEDRRRSYVEVSGRKGLGIKADDLVDALIKKALEEVQGRQITQAAAGQEQVARQIAVGALRYFLLKFSTRIIIAFDLKEALAFEGETGPYLQYSVVRARNIFRKYAETEPTFSPAGLGDWLRGEQIKEFLTGEDTETLWELVLLAGQLEMVVEQAAATSEPAVLAKYAFRLAQAFNNFYHRYHILSEADRARQLFLLYLVELVNQTLSRTLELLGIEVPERM